MGLFANMPIALAPGMGLNACRWRPTRYHSWLTGDSRLCVYGGWLSWIWPCALSSCSHGSLRGGIRLCRPHHFGSSAVAGSSNSCFDQACNRCWYWAMYVSRRLM
jgi:hypothetical protein